MRPHLERARVTRFDGNKLGCPDVAPVAGIEVIASARVKFLGLQHQLATVIARHGGVLGDADKTLRSCSRLVDCEDISYSIMAQ
jgi:hypothetical protein